VSRNFPKPRVCTNIFSSRSPESIRLARLSSKDRMEDLHYFHDMVWYPNRGRLLLDPRNKEPHCTLPFHALISPITNKHPARGTRRNIQLPKSGQNIDTKEAARIRRVWRRCQYPSRIICLYIFVFLPCIFTARLYKRYHTRHTLLNTFVSLYFSKE